MNDMDRDPNGQISGQRVAIVGVGGTGSHILDYLSKTPVGEIHVFDNDHCDNETKKRSPGPFNTRIRQAIKSSFYACRYCQTHPRIIPHEEYISSENVHQLSDFDTVFLSCNSPEISESVIDVCRSTKALLIHVGMGTVGEDRIEGNLSVITCRGDDYDLAESLIPRKTQRGVGHDYQTIELNAMNAALAVIQWKKASGVFVDLRTSPYFYYSITANKILES